MPAPSGGNPRRRAGQRMTPSQGFQAAMAAVEEVTRVRLRER
ncbi:MAG TPA: hypothetical protein VFQ76_02865 [Longimicrobiaceae bacterium]|nr:hypothetical protein [Longimicrobiaceae bacterium]